MYSNSITGAGKMKILLPMDMANPIDKIIEQLAAILPLAGQEVHCLYVNEAWPSYENVIGTQGQFADDWRQIVDEKAHAKLTEAENLLAGKCAKVTKEIVSGPPAMMIETVARDEHCDITVMMPGKHPKYEEIFQGSVTANVAKHGPGMILLIRKKDKFPTTLRTVIFGVDGSSNAKDAMLRAVEVFQLNKRDVKVLLFNAADVGDPIKAISPVEFISRVEQNLILEGETYLADAKRQLADVGVTNTEFAQRKGKPADELCELARSSNADLVIVGAEGRTAVQHFLLGSVSHRIAMQAPCAVAIMKKENKPS